MWGDIIGTGQHQIFGRTILANIHQGLKERIIANNHIKRYFGNLASGLTASPPTTELERRYLLHQSVWIASSYLQLQGPPCECKDCRLVHFKSLGNLARVVAHMDDDEPGKTIKAKVCKTFDVISDEECIELAESINSLSPDRTDLHLSPRFGSQRAITWFSQFEELIELVSVGGDVAATQIRDWLGLSCMVDGTPVFAFVSDRPFDKLRSDTTTVQLVRPTAFDGIDMEWFKHKRMGAYVDSWGRALYLKNSARPEDGGPEGVSSSLPIPGNFECHYVGRTNNDIASPDESFLNFLLGTDALQDIVDKFKAILAS